MDRGLEGGGGDPPRPDSSPVLPIGNTLRRRGCAGLENVQRIETARFSVAWNKDRVSAAVDRSHNHEIVRQMETFDTEVRMPFAELPPHPLLEALGGGRVIKKKNTITEKPDDIE